MDHMNAGKPTITAVVSGFASYPDLQVNPSIAVPRSLAGVQSLRMGRQAGADGVQDMCAVKVIPVSLPLSFSNAWPALQEQLERTKPDIVISTGVKHASRGISLERCATNLMDSTRQDADNTSPERGPISAEGPAAYWTRLPLRAILGDLSDQGIAATLSSDAGTFVCNSLFYHVLRWACTQEHVLAGFVSLPVDAGSEERHHGLSLDQMSAALRSILSEAAAYLDRPTTGDLDRVD